MARETRKEIGEFRLGDVVRLNSESEVKMTITWIGTLNVKCSWLDVDGHVQKLYINPDCLEKA